jgi:succinoglycan biosynthesis transport protein ExoP
MDLAGYIRIFRRWLWLIIVAAIVMGSISFVITRSRPIEYQASATVIVGSIYNVTNPNTGQLNVAEQLAQTYVQLVKAYPVLKATVDKLQLPMEPEALMRMFTVRIVPETSLIMITATYGDPLMVADIANELAAQLIANSPAPITDAQQQQIADLRLQIALVQTELQSARDELKTVEESLKTATGEERTSLLTRRSELVTQINATSVNYAQMNNTLANLEQQGNANSVSIVDKARVPDSPIPVPIVPITLMVAIIGGVLAAGVSILIEYLNDTIRSPAEIPALLGVNPIGTVRPFGNKATYDDKLVAWTQPRSTISEEYRAIRVNLMYREKGGSDKKHRTYITTSANPGDGKSVTAANLAVTFAITGMRVLIVDADLRRPVQHRLFNLPNTLGLANFLSAAEANKGGNNGSDKAAAEVAPNRYALRDYLTTTATGSARSNPMAEAGTAVQEAPPTTTSLAHSSRVPFSSIIQKSSVTGLDVITSGPSPINPTELLGTVQMQEMTDMLAHSDEYDVVIFDTPPILAVSDSTVLANVANAEVILVVHARKTHRSAAAHAVQQLAGLSIPIAGVVINRLNPRDTDAGYYGYYYGYYGYGAYNSSNAPREAHEMTTRLTPSTRTSREQDEE